MMSTHSVSKLSARHNSEGLITGLTEADEAHQGRVAGSTDLACHVKRRFTLASIPGARGSGKGALEQKYPAPTCHFVMKQLLEILPTKDLLFFRMTAPTSLLCPCKLAKSQHHVTPCWARDRT
jgi:hypothetical protein